MILTRLWDKHYAFYTFIRLRQNLNQDLSHHSAFHGQHLNLKAMGIPQINTLLTTTSFEIVIVRTFGFHWTGLHGWYVTTHCISWYEWNYFGSQKHLMGVKARLSVNKVSRVSKNFPYTFIPNYMIWPRLWPQLLICLLFRCCSVVLRW